MGRGTQDKSNHGYMVTSLIVCETMSSLLADQHVDRVALQCSGFDFIDQVVRHKDSQRNVLKSHLSSNIMVYNRTKSVGPILLGFEATGSPQVSFPSPQFCFLCLKGLFLGIQRLCPFQRLQTLQVTINVAWKRHDDWQAVFSPYWS